MKRAFSLIHICLILVSTFTFFTTAIQTVNANGTIYIRSDGSVDPSTAPIKREGDVYRFLADIDEPIVVQKDNITIEGNGYKVQGTQAFLSKGIDLARRCNVTVKNAEIMNFYDGIYLEGSYDNVILGNKIYNVTCGIRFAEFCSNNVISMNMIDNVGLGIDSRRASCNNLVSRNIVKNFSLYGICLESYSNNNSILYNNISAGFSTTATCIRLFNSHKNIVLGNNITGGLEGIQLGYADQNFFVQNNIQNNNYPIYGWSWGPGEGNKFYHNNFINNSWKVYLPSSNSWDDGYPSGGNYWSDYIGIDEKSGPYQNETGSDGIGDTPYIIDEKNRDNYPLMSPWVETPLDYVLNVQSIPIIGIQISYTGDYSGAGTTNFDIGPKTSPFIVTLTAPSTYENYKFSYWQLDGTNKGESNSLTVEVNDENRERTAIAVYSPKTAEPDFSISASPAISSIAPGRSISYTVTVTSINGFNSPVSLDGSIDPSTTDISLSLNPKTVTPPKDGSTQSTLTVSTTSTVAPKTYTIVVTGSGEGKVHSANVVLEVTGAPIRVSLVGPLNGILVFNFTYKEGGIQKVWNPKLIAKVNQNGNPEEGIEVKFFVDEKEVSTSTSDASGIAKVTYNNPIEGHHTWYAIAQSSKSETWGFDFKKPKEPPPSELLIDFICRWYTSSTEFVSLNVAKYHSKAYDSWGEQYWGGAPGKVEIPPASIGGSKPNINLLLNSEYIAYFSVYKITPGFSSSRTIVITVPKVFQIYDYSKKEWRDLNDVERNGPWMLNLVQSDVPPDLETTCNIPTKNGLWQFVRGPLWAKYGAIPFGEGKRIHDKFGTDTVDFLQFLQDDGFYIETLEGSKSLPEWAHVSMVQASFIDEDSSNVYYALVTEAPSILETLYFSMRVKPVKEGSFKFDVFKCPTISDKIAQVEQVLKIVKEAVDFASALTEAQNLYSIAAAIGTKGHSLYTEVSNLADLDKASHELINIKVSKSFLEAKVSSPANILIIDPLGRKTGFDPDDRESVNEIPNATYSGAETEPETIVIPEPMEGTYRLKVIGTESGTYVITITFSSRERPTNQINISSSIREGVTQEYNIQISPGGEICIPQFSPFPLYAYASAVVLASVGLIILFVLVRHRKSRTLKSISSEN